MVTTKQLMDKLQGMSELSDSELKLMQDCQDILKQLVSHEQKLAQIIPKLVPFMGKPLQLLKLCEYSPQIKIICHENSALLDALGKALIKKHVPGGEPMTVTSVNGVQKTFEHGGAIPTVNGSKPTYLVDTFIAGGIFTEYTKTKEPMFLDYACEKGFYAALRERCDQTRERIKTSVTNETYAKLNADYKLLNDDLAKLGNLYWAVGYLDAARIWRDLGSLFADILERDSENVYWRDTFCEAAAENIYMAQEVNGLGVSQHISHDLYGEKGDLATVYEFKDWNSGVEYALKPLNLSNGDLINKKIALQEVAKERIGGLLKTAENKSEAKPRI